MGKVKTDINEAIAAEFRYFENRPVFIDLDNAGIEIPDLSDEMKEQRLEDWGEDSAIDRMSELYDELEENYHTRYGSINLHAVYEQLRQWRRAHQALAKKLIGSAA